VDRYDHDTRPAAPELPPELPPELDSFGPRLERAVTRDMGRRARRRRLVTGATVAAVAAIAVFAGIAAFGIPGAHGPSGVDSASAVDKAAAALASPDGVIVHLHIVGTQAPAQPAATASGTTAAGDIKDPKAVRWEDESWQLTSEPFTRRQVENGPGAPTAESGVVDGRSALYEAATDTVYTGGEPWDGSYGEGEADSFRQKALAGLASGDAHVAGHETVDGRDALKIVVSPEEVYLVDAQTYDPIEWRTRGTSETGTLRFVAYEKLPVTPDNRKLLDLRAQHPDATVDADPVHYQEAMGRLFPNG
jgi:hypothetical protein